MAEGSPAARAAGPPARAGLPGRALAALERKYALLVLLRGRRDAGRAPPRELLRELSRTFPGCLRELDRNRATTLARRLATVRAVRAGRRMPPRWMVWIWRYHQTLGRWLARRAQTPAGGARRGPPRTPGGRPSSAALAMVAAQCGTTPARITRALFPPRRLAAAPPESGRLLDP